MSKQKYTLDTLRSDYAKKWAGLTIRPEWQQQIDHAVNRIMRGLETYQQLEQKTGVPWYVIGVIHHLEGSCNMGTHLHNGDPLTMRTRNVPKNRPPGGTPPFSFEESAVDALKYDGLTAWKDWTIAGISYKLETFNGFGYRMRKVGNPYLYSGSKWYSKGKYVADGVYDPNRVSKQVGCIVILKALTEARGITIPA